MWIASACVCIVVFASFTFIQSHTSFLFLYTKKESKVLNTLNSNIAFVTFLVYHVSDEMSRAMRAFLLLYLFFSLYKAELRIWAVLKSICFNVLHLV